jgi:threonyl-tRNA synthetase
MSISKNSQNLQLDTKRHSFAHLMAAAVKQYFETPNIKDVDPLKGVNAGVNANVQLGVGPVIENGCYYDFILPRTLIPEDLPLIENKIKEMLKQPLVFKVQEMELQEAISLFEKMNQPLKVELLNDLATRGTTAMSEEERADFESPQSSVKEKTPNIKDFDPLKENPQNPSDSDPLKENPQSSVKEKTPNIKDFDPLEENPQSSANFDPLEENPQSSVKEKTPNIKDFDPLEGNPQSSANFDPLKGVMEEEDSLEGVRAIYQNKFTEIGFTFPANKDLSDRAKEMSKNMTKAEQLVWFNILESNKTGFKWTKQKVIDNYIVDFYCHSLGLVLEIDGDSHSERQEYDEMRTKFLNNFGLEVVRFTNDEVYNNLDGIAQNLKKIMSLREKEITEKLPLSRGLNSKSSGGLKITVYRLENEKTGEDLFVDLCKGPHVRGTNGFKEMRSLGFKLDKFSGSYWRGDQKRNIQMQRIYALVFDTKEELKEFEEKRKLAQERDHRKLGKELEIFMVSEEVGAGLPLYLPNGATIRQLLEKYCYQEAKKAGYQYVYTPHIGKSDLFAKSGHLDHYADGMYAPIDMVNLKGEGALADGKTEKFYLKPMNCPMHHNIYLNTPKSYRDLPYRLYEYGTVYRYEESGTLSGMIRVRGFTQNDAHVYCQRSQLKEVIGEALNRFIKAYKDIGITDYKMRFSLPDFVNDKEKYGEETIEWTESVSAMRQALDELGVDYYDAVGEAAFYGPKIDIQVKNVNGKEDSLSTIQVDYSIAPKFGITFKNEKGEDEVPAIIHMALMGSVDRFMAFMLEMTGGRLPLWLAPTQVKILTINNEESTMNYVAKIKEVLDETVLMQPLKYNEMRYEVDDRNESLGKKIREATKAKIPVMLIVGPKDVQAGEVSIRTQEGESKVRLEGLSEFLQNLK